MFHGRRKCSLARHTCVRPNAPLTSAFVRRSASLRRSQFIAASAQAGAYSANVVAQLYTSVGRSVQVGACAERLRRWRYYVFEYFVLDLARYMRCRKFLLLTVGSYSDPSRCLYGTQAYGTTADWYLYMYM